MSDEQIKLEQFEPGNEVYAVLNRLKTGPNAPARISIYIKNFPEEIINILEEFGDEKLKTSSILENEKLRLIEISSEEQMIKREIACPHCKKNISIEKKLKFIPKNYIIEYKNENVMIFVSSYPKTQYELIIKRLNRLYPIISRIYYRSNDLHKVLDELTKRNLTVVGKYNVAKRLYGGKKTSVNYEEDSIEGLFNKAHNQNVWIDSLRVSIDSIGELGINRRGHINYQTPFNFKNFFEEFVSTVIVEVILKRRKNLEGKSRTESNPQKISPIILKLEKDYFSEDKNFEKLFSKLKNDNDYNLAIISFSKKSAHLMIFDYPNGCGFDIYINSGNQLKIVPQTQVTVNALDSLIIKINDVFEEIQNGN